MKTMLLTDLLPKVICAFKVVYNGEYTTMYCTSDWLEANSLYGDKRVTYIISDNKYLIIGVEDNESI